MDEQELESLLRTLNLQGLVRRNQNLMALCPFHNERSPSWGISIHPPHFHGCFACGAKGTLYDLLVKFGSLSPAALRAFKVQTDKGVRLDSLEKTPVTPTVLDHRALFVFRLSHRAFNYMRSRGVPDWALIRAKCLYDPFQMRVIFPWYLHGKLHGVTGRAVNPHNKVRTLPYLNTKKGDFLYLPKGEIGAGPLIVVEGEIDALKVFASGFDNVAAVGFGGFSNRQRSLVLNSEATGIVSFLDFDTRGHKLHEHVQQMFDGKLPVSRVSYARAQRMFPWRSKHDPGALPRQVLRKMLTEDLEKHSDWPSF